MLLTTNVSNKSGNLLFAQSYPEQYENVRFVHSWCTVDGKGFIKTGPDWTAEELNDAHWPLGRRPYLPETTLPGVFAVGDVHGGNVKRVASLLAKDRSRFRSCIKC
jgi:hypothetical protein